MIMTFILMPMSAAIPPLLKSGPNEGLAEYLKCYNEYQPHQALDSMTPNEYFQQWMDGCLMSLICLEPVLRVVARETQ